MFRHRLIAAFALAAWLLAWGSVALHLHGHAHHGHDHAAVEPAGADGAAAVNAARSAGCRHHGHAHKAAVRLHGQGVVEFPAAGESGCVLCELLAVAFRPAEVVSVPARDVRYAPRRTSLRATALSAPPSLWQSRAPPVCS